MRGTRCQLGRSALPLGLVLAVCSCGNRQDDPTLAWQTPSACAVALAASLDDNSNAIEILEITGERAGPVAHRVVSSCLSRTVPMKDSWEKVRALLRIGRAAYRAKVESTALAEAEKVAPRVQPDTERLGALAEVAAGYADVGRGADATRVAGALRRDVESWKGIGDYTFARWPAWAASTSGRAGLTEVALAALAEAEAMARRRGGTVHDPWLCWAWWSVGMACLDVGDLDRAVAAAQALDNSVFLPDEGEARFSQVRYKIIILINVAMRYAELGKKEDACRILSRAHGVARNIEFPYLQAEMLKDVALTYAAAGKYQGVIMLDGLPTWDAPDLPRGLEVAREIKHRLIKALTLDWIAARPLKTGDLQLAGRILSEAVGVAKGIEKGASDALASELGFVDISVEYVLGILAGDLAEAGLFDEAHEAGMKIGDPTNPAIAMGYAQRGRKKEAAELLAREAKAGRPCKALALAYAELGQWDQAAKAAQAIDYPENQTDAIAELAFRNAQAGRFEEAIALAGTIQDPYHMARALAKIGELYSPPRGTAGEQARDLLRHILTGPRQEQRAQSLDKI